MVSRRCLPRSVLGAGEEEGRSMLSNKFLRVRVQKGEVVTTAVRVGFAYSWASWCTWSLGPGCWGGSLSSWCLAQRPEGECPLLTFPRPTRPDRGGSRQIREPQIVGF